MVLSIVLLPLGMLLVLAVVLYPWEEGIRLDCGPGRMKGRHERVVVDLGGMGDARLCLRCGAEGYDRQDLLDAEQFLKATPELLEEIKSARELPGALNERVKGEVDAANR